MRTRYGGNRKEDAGSSEQHCSCGMIAAFMQPVRVARNNQERDSANDEGESVENSRRKAAQFFEILHRAGQPEQESHLAADKTKIDSSQQKHAGTQQSPQGGNFFLALEFRVLPE